MALHAVYGFVVNLLVFNEEKPKHVFVAGVQPPSPLKKNWKGGGCTHAVRELTCHIICFMKLVCELFPFIYHSDISQILKRQK